MFNFDDVTRKNKEAMDTLMKGYSEMAKGFQAIATEATDFSKQSLKDNVAHVEALSSVRSVETAFELQTSFLKSSYESFIAQGTRIGEMYADLARSAYKPFEMSLTKTV